MLQTLDCAFRLKTWTIYHAGERTTSPTRSSSNTTEGHKTLRHACNAIARKLEKEWTDRARKYEQR